MDLRMQAFKNLLTANEIFKQLKIPYMVSSGLLLGLYRDGDIIPGDEDDIDLYLDKKIF